MDAFEEDKENEDMASEKRARRNSKIEERTSGVDRFFS